MQVCRGSLLAGAGVQPLVGERKGACLSRRTAAGRGAAGPLPVRSPPLLVGVCVGGGAAVLMEAEAVEGQTVGQRGAVEGGPRG